MIVWFEMQTFPLSVKYSYEKMNIFHNKIQQKTISAKFWNSVFLMQSLPFILGKLWAAMNEKAIIMSILTFMEPIFYCIIVMDALRHAIAYSYPNSGWSRYRQRFTWIDTSKEFGLWDFPFNENMISNNAG